MHGGSLAPVAASLARNLRRMATARYVPLSVDPTPPSLDDAPIRLRGVRQNNLRGIDVDIPYGRLTVVTGVSGSGKSSLAFDTLYAEGRRRYVESFSAYARQFFDRLPRPAADRIDDLPPAVAVEQRNPVRTSRSTVGTMTELLDHLKVLFAKLAVLHCDSCGAEVHPEGAADLADAFERLDDGTRALVAFPAPPDGGLPWAQQVGGLRAAGFVRWVSSSGGAAQPLEVDARPPEGTAVEIVVDRVVAGRTSRSRLLDAAEQALRHGRGTATLHAVDGDVQRFSNTLHCAPCDRHYRAARPNLFSFNSPLGACETCKGFGAVLGLDPAKVVPDRTLSLDQGAIRPWTTPRMGGERARLREFCSDHDIPLDVPFGRLDEDDQDAVLHGANGYGGVAGWMGRLEQKAYKMRVRVMLARYRGQHTCSDCGGTRRRASALGWRLLGHTIADFEHVPIAEVRRLLETLAGGGARRAVAEVVLDGALARLRYLDEVGLGYLTLARQTKTLSGGEFQRVNLATALGAALVHTLYVLDEPSIGLHPRDADRLLGILGRLRDRGNTLVVVEHDPDTIRAADHVLDIGPGAGRLGGELQFAGPLDELLRRDTPTARFLRGDERVEAPPAAPPADEGELVLTGCTGHNLQDVELRLPRGRLTVVCGVSGSGKSSLLVGTLHPAVRRALGDSADTPLPYASLSGASAFARCDLVDQSPIGRTPRSNPATYSGAIRPLRKLFAATPDAKRRRLSAKRFSFNDRRGRCPACDGAGYETLEMQFLADVHVLCAECEGRRFRPEVLEVRYRGLDFHETLQLTVDEALAHFDGGGDERAVRAKLEPLAAVGLGYLSLGQAGTTLSGGEAQRLKLATHLPSRRITRSKRGLFVFDEPTTGLHLSDVRTLLACLRRLVDAGHTAVVIEHHLSVLAAADHVVELGPEGGAGGGRIVAEGTPEQIARGDTATAPFLAAELDRLGARAETSA